MKVSGFTIIRNARKFNYPVLESIRSILPVCDEFIVNVGRSEDDTLEMVRSLNNPKLRIVETDWDFSKGNIELSHQTNIALNECKGDWAFYLQSDELVHEADLPRLRRLMQNCLNKDVDALRFSWMHFYGSYYRYRIDSGWYQKQDRIVRNNRTVESTGDAYGFQRADGRPLRRQLTGCFLYHYGWVQPQEVMAQRRINAQMMGIATLQEEEKKKTAYSYGDLNRFPVYFGSHPSEMKERIAAHQFSQDDREDIKKKNILNPFFYLRTRYKTPFRVRSKIN